MAELLQQRDHAALYFIAAMIAADRDAHGWPPLPVSEIDLYSFI
jgi:hypothetical protein